MTAKEINPKKLHGLEKLSLILTNWIGTTQSLIVHSIFFMGSLSLAFLGVSSDKILLILTTVVSLEAIYLSIFIQMTVNRNTQSLEEVEEDIEDIQEDVKGLEEDVDEISEDLDDIQEEDKKDNAEEKQTKAALKNIEDDLDRLLSDIENLKKNLPGSNGKKFLNG